MKPLSRTSRLEIQSKMARWPISMLRGVLLGIASGGSAFFVVLFLGGMFPVKVHAWVLGLLAVVFTISDAHFKSLSSELSALLRRGTYSVWQLEQLNQVIPAIQKRISFAWSLSVWLKAGVALASALLLWDGLPAVDRPVVMFLGYTCLLYSGPYALWARQNYRKLEQEVNAITAKEVSLKERRRLASGITSGDPHDFSKDKLASGYTNPPKPLHS